MFCWSRLRPQPLKGRDEITRVYRVIGVKHGCRLIWLVMLDVNVNGTYTVFFIKDGVEQSKVPVNVRYLFADSYDLLHERYRVVCNIRYTPRLSSTSRKFLDDVVDTEQGGRQ